MRRARNHCSTTTADTAARTIAPSTPARQVPTTSSTTNSDGGHRRVEGRRETRGGANRGNQPEVVARELQGPAERRGEPRADLQEGISGPSEWPPPMATAHVTNFVRTVRTGYSRHIRRRPPSSGGRRCRARPGRGTARWRRRPGRRGPARGRCAETGAGARGRAGPGGSTRSRSGEHTTARPAKMPMSSASNRNRSSSRSSGRRRGRRLLTVRPPGGRAR